MKLFFYTLFLSSFMVFLIWGCKKNQVGTISSNISDEVSSSQAMLKINYASLYEDNRYVLIKLNGQRVSSLLRGRTPYPGGGLNTYGSNYPLFFAVEAGDVSVDITMPYTEDSAHNGADSAVLYSTAINLTAGNTYVLHITDTSDNTNSVLTTENLNKADSGYNVYRFINLMPNVEAVDLYYGTSSSAVTGDTLLASNISYLSQSDYITLPIKSTRYWKIRPAGADVTSSTVLAYYSSSSSYVNSRTFTIYALGYNGITTAPRKPYVSFLYIQ
ncbi:MAG: hypothetical protein QM640_08325 [Niabella sp.]